MAKKKNQDPAPVEEHLTEPATDAPAITEDVAIPEPATPDWKWPEATEARPLLVAWDDHDRSEAAVKFAELQRQKNTAEDRKKAAASQAKAIIDGLEEELNALMTRIEENGENRRVECRWYFETAGKDDTGALITHPEMKTLLREDTGEVVTICKITPDDRQLVMSLPDGQSLEDCEAAITGFGYELLLNETPEEGDTPFFIRNLSDAKDEECVEGDSRLTAARAAVKILQGYADFAASCAAGDGTPENSADPTTSQDSDPAPGGDSGAYNADADDTNDAHVEAAVNSASTEAANARGDTEEPSSEVMEAIREDGATTRRTRGKNSRANCPYDPGTNERAFWKAGFDAEDDRMEREMAAAEPQSAGTA